MHNSNISKKVIVAMSGGVDSSVSAALLKRAGFSVTGVFMKCWDDPNMKFGCTAEEDEYEARRAAARIGIPIFTLDFVQEYKEKVLDYFVREYAAGRTPNPDVMCNKEIKFGLFFKKAREELGADFVATGHYARLCREFSIRRLADQFFPLRGIWRSHDKFQKQLTLFKGKDKNKDQSYFLYTLKQEQLPHIIFPVGAYKKDKVRALARNFDLPNAERKDSQGICFLGKISVQDFLEQYIPASPGNILDESGRGIGVHQGLHRFTIGQRHGVGVGGGKPYYVFAKDYKTNTLRVSFGESSALYSKALIISDVHWINKAPALPLACSAKIRYRQPDQCVMLDLDGSGRLQARFKKDQRASASGQSVVFYKGDQCLGGGVIV